MDAPEGGKDWASGGVERSNGNEANSVSRRSHHQEKFHHILIRAAELVMFAAGVTARMASRVAASARMSAECLGSLRSFHLGSMAAAETSRAMLASEGMKAA